MQGSIWNNKVPFDWLAVHKNGTSSCLSCSMGLYNQLLIKVAFWNWNSKTLPHLSNSLCFLFAWLPFHCFIYNALAVFKMSYYEAKVCLHGVVSSFWGARFITAKGLLCQMMTVSYSELNVQSIICFILCRKYVMFEWLFVQMYSIYLTEMRLIRSICSFLVYKSMTGLCIKKIHIMTILVLYIHIQYIHTFYL